MESRIRVRLPTELMDKLLKLSKDSGMSISKLVVHILTEYLLQH